MKAFAALTERLAFEPGRTAKLRLIEDYLRETPDPDRGYALAALTGTLDFPDAKPAMLRGLIEARMDPELFRLSYDYVGDLAETIALAWPRRSDAETLPDLPLSDVVDTLARTSRRETPQVVERWLDRLDEPERFALLKLMTGGLRIGVSVGLAKQALARLGHVPQEEIEEVWHGAKPPYTDLFAWIEGRAERPDVAGAPLFRSPMLAQALDEADLPALPTADFMAEWKWDGIRVQAVGHVGDNLARRRLYSRTGEDIGAGFPDLVAALAFDATLDGELVVLEQGAAATFSRLQQRLNRKAPTSAHMAENPVGIVAYDLLFQSDEDLRPLPFAERRQRLERYVADLGNPRILLSPLVPFTTWEDLAAARAASRERPGIEGVMLKRRDSVYVAGRPRGPWFKWKRDPDLVDCVLMYAQRGHGKRSSYYSDYTFGVWQEDAAGRRLVPVGKAYFGFTDAELLEIDRFVRTNTLNRFGPVREVTHTATTGLVFEVAHEGLQRSGRHKSGIAMRFPRIARIRWDKPPGEADTLDRLLKELAAAEARGVAPADEPPQ